MQEDNLDEILEMNEDEFLAGPDRGDAEYEVDDIFAKKFDSVLADWMSDAGHTGTEDELLAIVLADPLDPVDYDGFRVVTAPDPAYGVVALVGDRLAGIYVGADVVVREEFREKGIGSALVVERYKRCGDLPTWHHDTAAYSRAGAAAHRTAFRMLRAEARAEARQVPAP